MCKTLTFEAMCYHRKTPHWNQLNSGPKNWTKLKKTMDLWLLHIFSLCLHQLSLLVCFCAYTCIYPMVASDYIYSVINAVTMSLHPWSLLLNLFNRSSRSFVHQSACSNKIFISPAQVDTVLAKAQAYSPPGSPSCTVAPILTSS